MISFCHGIVCDDFGVVFRWSVPLKIEKKTVFSIRPGSLLPIGISGKGKFTYMNGLICLVYVCK